MKVETLAEQLLFTTVNLEAHGNDGVSFGTGFVHSLETNAGTAHLLVSNQHVFAAATDRLVVRMINGKDGGPLLGDVRGVEWRDAHAAITAHPDGNVDLAVLPFTRVLQELHAQGVDPFFRAVPAAMCLTREEAEELDALERIVFIGYPNNIYDRTNNTPIIRQGITATRIALDYNGIPAFLIDAAVYPGSSGSPVFIYDGGTYMNRGGVVVGSRAIFLGVLAGVHVRKVEADIVTTKVGVEFQDPLNLGIVFKAHALTDLVDGLLKNSGLERAAAQPPEPSASGEETEADEAIREAAHE